MEEPVCRICLVENGEFQTIFTSVQLEETNTTMHLSEMICSFAHIQITLGDDLPELICRNCAEEAVHMYFFKARCEESDRVLRTKLANKQLSNNADHNVAQVPIIKSEQSDHEHPFDPRIVDDFSEDFSNFDYGDSVSEDNDESVDLFESSDKVQKPEKFKEYECNICFKRFTREDLLLRHKIAHAMKMQDFTEKLNESENSDLETEEDVKEMVKNDNSETSNINKSNISNKSSKFKCILCIYIAANKDSLDKHIINKHLILLKGEDKKKDSFICKDCNSEVSDVNYFEKHVKDNHLRKRERFTCRFCLLEYSKQSSLNEHLICHKIRDEDGTGEENNFEEYPCTHCNKTFKSKKYLRRHQSRLKVANIRIDSKKKPHICEICLKAFNQLSNLKDHLRIHNGEKPFLCPSCGKGFNQLGNLRQHQLRHSGVKSHICTTCGHSFATKGELHAHLRKHTGAKPFICDSCGNGFTTSSSLTKHKRIHSGEKPYECDYCKMKFSRSGILSRHKRIHTGEKPYVCQICKKGFTQSNDLNSHLRIHTGEKPYKCNECGQPFRQRSALRTHRKTHLEPKSHHRREAAPRKEFGIFGEDEGSALVNIVY